MKHDVIFEITSGDNRGDVYRYTLVTDGKKLWEVTPKFKPAPSMIKEQIDMTIAVRDYNIPNSGATELRAASKIIEELSLIARADAKMTGLDNITRDIKIDQDGFTITSSVTEKGKDAEYGVKVRCWGLY
jgi:hypothetical protein